MAAATFLADAAPATASPESASPFQSLLPAGGEDMLRLVLEYVGPGRYRFVGAVNRSWNRIYLSVHRATPQKLGGKYTTHAATSESKAAMTILLEESASCSYHYHNDMSKAIFEAARRGDMTMVQWVRARHQSRYCSTRIMEGAAHGHHLHMMKWGRASECEWDWFTCFYAARCGHLKVLKWARANGCDWDSRTCAEAAEGGHLEVLKWARANGCDWNEYTCSNAARGGHLEVLQWARANNCPWNACTCAEAARGGHLEVLKWAISNQCPWERQCCVRRAQLQGHGDVVEWIESNDLEGN